METCLWVSPWEKMPDSGYDRLYIGDEACGRFLTDGVLPRRLHSVTSAGKRAGVIVPYLTPERETDFLRLLDQLHDPVDMVVNDAGAFRLIQRSIHTPILGRLLVRQNTDPAIASFFRDQPRRLVYDGTEPAVLEHVNPPHSLAVHFSGSPVFSDRTAALFLSGRETMTVMLDILPHGMPKQLPDNYTAILNTENILVSVLPCRSCEGCPDSEVLLGKTRANVPIYRKRNTCYYKLSESAGAVLEIPEYVNIVLKIF